MSTTKTARPGLFSTLRDDIAAAGFEFVGTTFWLLLGLGGIETAYAVAGDKTSVGHIFFAAASMGLSLIAASWIFFRGTGGLFNPNVSLALMLVGAIGPVRFVLYCIAQILGAIAAAGLVHGLIPGRLDVDTYLSAETSRTRGVFIEMFITASLALVVLSLSAEKNRSKPFGSRNKHRNTDTTNIDHGNNYGNTTSGAYGDHHRMSGGHGASNRDSAATPIAFGMTVFACHLFAYLWTGASMNSARSFGPGVWNRFRNDYHGHHWIYWVGPLLGSLLAAALYTVMKLFGYWRLTPDQSVSEYSDSPPGIVNGMKNNMTGNNPNAYEGTGHGATDNTRLGTHGTTDNTRLGTHGVDGSNTTNGYNRPVAHV